MTLLFLFDMDDVLYDYDWRARMAGLTALTGLDLAELRRRWWHDEGEWAAEAGRFPTARATGRRSATPWGCEIVGRRLGRQPPLGDARPARRDRLGAARRRARAR